MMRNRWLLAPLVTAVVAACGGSGGPTAPPTPTGTPAPTETFTVTVIVYDDENHNGRAEDREDVWLPDVEVEIAGRTGVSERRTGRTVITGVPRGSHRVGFKAASLSPYYQPGAPITIDVPQAPDTATRVPLVLPIGTNNPGWYLFSGDSISQGTSATDARGFRPLVRNRLAEYYGRASEAYRGGGGGQTADVLPRLQNDLNDIRPAVVVFNWGVNDFYVDGCSVPSASTCSMAANYRSMIRIARQNNSLPALATILPCNTGFNGQAPPQRNDWVRQVNELIRGVAQSERVLLVDVGAEFFRQSDLSRLFVDHVHPNDAGYELMAEVYTKALTRGAVAGTSASSFLLFLPPGFDEPALR